MARKPNEQKHLNTALLRVRTAKQDTTIVSERKTMPSGKITGINAYNRNTHLEMRHKPPKGNDDHKAKKVEITKSFEEHLKIEMEKKK